MTTYRSGQQIHFDMTFVDSLTNSPIDPVVITLTITNGNGTETVFTYGVGSTILRLGTGHYEADIDTQDLELAGFCTAEVVTDPQGTPGRLAPSDARTGFTVVT